MLSLFSDSVGPAHSDRPHWLRPTLPAAARKPGGDSCLGSTLKPAMPGASPAFQAGADRPGLSPPSQGLAWTCWGPSSLSCLSPPCAPACSGSHQQSRCFQTREEQEWDEVAEEAGRAEGDEGADVWGLWGQRSLWRLRRLRGLRKLRRVEGLRELKETRGAEGDRGGSGRLRG